MTSEKSGRTNRSVAWVATAVVLTAGLVRVVDLDRRSFGHPENYVPGLDVPAWVHDPPERTDLPSLAKSLLRDAHPPLYYVMMLPWVRVFGYTEFWIRLPSVLLGVGAVVLLYRIALREARPETALVAAAFLAEHGQQIYWSQTARVYALAIFLGLLSTLALWKALEDGRRRWRVAYGLSAVAALWTHVYCWPVVAVQILWATLRSIRRRTPPAVLATQVVALIVSMPVVALAIFLYRPIVSADPTLEYFEFGYLFWSGASFGEPLPAATAAVSRAHAWILALGAASVVVGLLARPIAAIARDAPARATSRGRSRLAILALGAAMSAAIVLAAFQAFHPGTDRFAKVLAVAAVPIVLAAALPAIEALVRRAQARGRGWLPWLAGRMTRLSPLLALGPYLAMVAGSIVEPAFLARGTMIYVPFLLLVAATGLTPAGRFGWTALPALAAALLLFSASTVHSSQTEHGLRDYRAFGRELRRVVAPGDLILITNEYSDPPLLYYLRDRHAQFVPSNWAEAIAAKKPGRVWVIRYEDQQMTPALDAAVAGLRPGMTLRAPGARALGFVR
jgi:Dolichyl-phosphate-mannose-protein mannosyltransferase